jgi:uroporphyrinogen-III synthase
MGGKAFWTVSEMDKNKAQILCTGPIGQSLIDKMLAHGIDMDIVPLIAMKPFSNKSLEAEIIHLFQQSANIVFTSTNAVNAVATFKGKHAPCWKIYCIGHATQKAVAECFGAEKIILTADNASELAGKIIKQGNIKEMVFFCGDIHRDELPDKLKRAEISVREMIVYGILATPKKVSKEYDAVLFFSPSAVNSFFEVNEANKKTLFFAIGDTTAAAICEKTSNVVIVSNKPSKEELLELAIKYFSEQSSKRIEQ